MDGEPEVVADKLLGAVKGSEDDARHYRELFAECGVAPERGLAELFYLKSIAVDYGAFMALRGHPRMNTFLQAYRDRLGQFVNQMYSPDDFDARQFAYFEVFKRGIEGKPLRMEDGRQIEAHNGFYAVAVKFSEFCGGGDVLLLAVGRTFGEYLWNTYNFIKSLNRLA